MRPGASRHMGEICDIGLFCPGPSEFDQALRRFGVCILPRPFGDLLYAFCPGPSEFDQALRRFDLFCSGPSDVFLIRCFVKELIMFQCVCIRFRIVMDLKCILVRLYLFVYYQGCDCCRKNYVWLDPSVRVRRQPMVTRRSRRLNSNYVFC